MIEKLFEELAAIPQIEAMALGGSRAGDEFDEKSDYDLYLYCTAPIDTEVRRMILEKYCAYMEIGNSFWETEDNCVLNNGVDIDILYRNLNDFTTQVSNVVERFQASNGYTTCMWHNLITCKIIYDSAGRLTKTKERFSVPYPAALKKNIIDRNMKLLCDAMPAYRSQIEKAIKRNDIVSIGHRTTAFMESYFDIIFAMNELTHPGEKRLVELCKKRCTLLPRNFEENIERLYAHMFSVTEKVNSDIEDIIFELKNILGESINEKH